MGHLSTFLHGLGNDLLKLRPHQSMILGGQSENYDSHVQAARANDGSYAVVYDAGGGTLQLDLSGLSGADIRARWFNPRDGQFVDHADSVSGTPNETVAAPSAGEDWVLLLDAR